MGARRTGCRWRYQCPRADGYRKLTLHSERCAALPGRRTCAGSGTDSLRDRSLIDAADACEQAPSNKASPVRLSRDMGIFCRARWDGWTTGQPEVAPLSMKRASAANGVNRMEVFRYPRVGWCDAADLSLQASGVETLLPPAEDGAQRRMRVRRGGHPWLRHPLIQRRSSVAAHGTVRCPPPAGSMHRRRSG